MKLIQCRQDSETESGFKIQEPASCPSYLRYVFKGIYVIPVFPNPRLYKTELLRRRLNQNEIFTLEYGKSYSPYTKKTESNREILLKSLELVLKHALDKCFLRILILNDRAMPILDFESCFMKQTTGQHSRPWDIMTFDSGAYGLTVRACRELLGLLKNPDTRSENVIKILIESMPSFDLGPLICDIEKISRYDPVKYLYHYDQSNKRISVCCVSRRPEYLENIFLNFKRQTYPDKELIIVLNGSGHNPERVTAMAEKFKLTHFQVLSPGAGVSLGHCLNMGVSCSTGFYWCKIDDDDYYGTNYLQEAWEFTTTFSCPLAGKSRMHVFRIDTHCGFVTTDKEYARLDFPRQTGATIFSTKQFIESTPFLDLNSGEDTSFFKAVYNKGVSFTDTTRDNYVYVRHGDNTSDYEAHISVNWSLENSLLYHHFIHEYPHVHSIDMDLIKPDKFGLFYDKKISHKMRGMAFPRIIHQIWLGPRNRPDNWMNTWKFDFIAQHPEWRYRFWSEKEVTHFDVIHTDAYGKLTTTGKSDLLRYEILYQYGGIYIDADSLFINSTSLETIAADVEKTGLLLAEEPFQPDKGILIANGVIAAKKGNPLLKYLFHQGVSRVNDAINRNEELVAWQMTGPKMVTAVLMHVKNVTILPHFYFYPEYWNTDKFWSLTKDELEERYPHSIMFQFGYSTINGEL